MPKKHLTFGFKWDHNNPNYNKNAEYQLLFFHAQEDYLNDRLKAGKFITVNDVADMFGFGRSPQGMVYGWDSDETIKFIIRRHEDGSVTLELFASDIYTQMRPRPNFTRDTAPVGVVCTLGHPANKCLIIKTNNGWRYVNGYAWVDPEDFQDGFDIYDPFKENI